MKKYSVLFFVGSLAAIALIIILLSWLVMSLWNYALAPVIDGINNISIGQALALMVLSNILFKLHVNDIKKG